MAKDEVPTSKAAIYNLQQPEKLSKVLAEDKVDDCLSCRLTGTLKGQHFVSLKTHADD